MKIIVDAKANSTTGGTGKVVGTFNRGALLVLSCDPQNFWSIGHNLDCDANGFPGSKNPNWQMNNGAMVASIDHGKSFFPIGVLCEFTVTADKTELSLYCLDTNNGDNSGTINVRVLHFNPVNP